MHFRHFLPAAAVAACLAGPALLRDVHAAETTPAAPAASSTASASRLAEIRAARESGERTIAVLRARLTRAAARPQALDLRRQIARAKLESEAAILRVQADWARREGHEDLARTFEREAAAMLAPRPRHAAAARRGPDR